MTAKRVELYWMTHLTSYISASAAQHCIVYVKENMYPAYIQYAPPFRDPIIMLRAILKIDSLFI